MERKQDHSTAIRLAIIRKLDCAKCSQRFGDIEIFIIASETADQCSHSGKQYALHSKIRYIYIPKLLRFCACLYSSEIFIEAHESTCTGSLLKC